MTQFWKLFLCSHLSCYDLNICLNLSVQMHFNLFKNQDVFCVYIFICCACILMHTHTHVCVCMYIYMCIYLQIKNIVFHSGKCEEHIISLILKKHFSFAAGLNISPEGQLRILSCTRTCKTWTSEFTCNWGNAFPRVVPLSLKSSSVITQLFREGPGAQGHCKGQV